MQHLVPATCWWVVLPSMVCTACPISWNRFSNVEAVSRVGLPRLGGGRERVTAIMGFCGVVWM